MEFTLAQYPSSSICSVKSFLTKFLLHQIFLKAITVASGMDAKLYEHLNSLKVYASNNKNIGSKII